ncbi:hypothetical protein Oscil6304_2929 [Oscillatoria acuminata PCC 6304]|uniref:Uncharacterized protein n=1 Tax=Oscillatoria acuminata PCC 6304 TaxID=56110 RepID=K9TIZ6_9CYAN|nr:hypothetical protein Oscil6304_2929 [Oscillatoria acuminata PCC 6304]
MGFFLWSSGVRRIGLEGSGKSVRQGSGLSDRRLYQRTQKMQMSEYRYDIPSLPFLWRVYVKMLTSELTQ